MSGTAYVVRVRYRVDDGASGPIAQIADKADRAGKKSRGAKAELSGFAEGLASRFSSLGETVTGAFDGIVSGAAKGGAAMIAMATVAAGKAVAEGFKVNAAVEDSTIAFQSIFNTFGVTNSFEAGLSPAKELIEGIRKDAAALPGEFQDFVDMAQTIGPALFGAGKSVADIRRETSNLAAAAASVGMKGKGGFEQAAREYAELIEGRAGTHNKLGLKFGIDSHTKVGGVEYNKASKDARMDFLQQRMGKAREALSAYERSWSGITSTMSDNFKASMGRITAPVMERVKASMMRIMKLSDGPGLANFEDRAGRALVEAYDFVERKTIAVVNHWREIRGFAHEVRDAMGKAYDFAKPAIDASKSFLGGAMSDPSHALAQVLGLRAGASLFSSAVPAAAEAGGAVAGGATAGIGIALAIALIDDVGNSVKRLSDWATSWGSTIMNLFGSLFEKGSLFRDILGGIGSGFIFFIDVVFTPLKIAIDVVSAAIRGLNDLWADLKSALFDVDGALRGVGDALSAVWNWVTGFVSNLRNLVSDSEKGSGSPMLNQMKTFYQNNVADVQTQAQIGMKIGIPLAMALLGAAGGGQDTPKQQLNELKSTLKGLGGKGGTNVTVNAPLTVLSDSDPDRLAEKVGEHLKRKLAAPNKSIATRSFIQ